MNNQVLQGKDMKTLFFECSSGAAGDMLSASLIELLPDREDFLKRINAIFAPNIFFEAEKVNKHSITGTQLHVKINGEEEGEKEHHHHHHHSHRSLADISEIINSLDLSDEIKKDVISVYNIIADAESKVHGIDVSEIHLHEVGALDAIADITAFCMLIRELGAEKIVSSPINVGFGSVECAHGMLPVPAPATALILKDIPIYSNDISGELCTPTGAALLKNFADEFSNMPKMKLNKTGYGFGKKDLKTPNCVRAFIGEGEKKSEQVVQLECNIDDMTAEEIAFACEYLLENGAKDVFTTAIGMKKSRLGTMISVLCAEKDKEKMLSLIFRHTTTLGVREILCERHTLSRSIENISTPYGNIRIKKSEGFGAENCKIEYDDIAKIAREQNLSFRQAKELLKQHYE